MKILGIDPGLNTTGYGILEISDQASPKIVTYGAIKTNAKMTLATRLNKIFENISKIAKEYRPDIVAVESLFYAENVKTAIVMGHARGAVLVAAMQHNAAVVEFSPREVKMSVVGNGAASKEQVNFMVRQILKLRQEIKPDDASDALAIALCHWHRSKLNKL